MTCIQKFHRVLYIRSQDSSIIPDVLPEDTHNESDDPSSKKLPYRADELFVKSYGRSLMAGYCDKYMSDFVLMGLPSLDEFQESLDIDLKNSLLVKVFVLYRQKNQEELIYTYIYSLDATIIFSRHNFKICMHLR